jgi:hypothetical protein
MTKDELLAEIERLAEQADIASTGLKVIREHLDEIHKDLERLSPSTSR